MIKGIKYNQPYRLREPYRQNQPITIDAHGKVKSRATREERKNSSNRFVWWLETVCMRLFAFGRC